MVCITSYRASQRHTIFQYDMVAAPWRHRTAVILLAVRSPRVVGAAFLLCVVFLLYVIKLSKWNRLQIGFQPRLTENERTVLLRTAKVFVDAVKAANLSYHIWGGTLLGSRRYHCFVPWDDDFDVLMNIAEQSKTKDALTRLAPDYIILERNGPWVWKFFSADRTTSIPGCFGCRFPYVDIFFYARGERHIQEHFNGNRWKTETVFPFVARPFCGLLLNAPKDVASWLSEEFHVNDVNELDTECVENRFDHRRDRSLKSAWYDRIHRLPCRLLWPRFPFVFRSVSSSGRVEEELRLGNRTISSYVVP